MSNNANKTFRNGGKNSRTTTDYSQRGGAQTPAFRKPTPPPPPKATNK